MWAITEGECGGPFLLFKQTLFLRSFRCKIRCAMANVIAVLNKPTLIIWHNKTLEAQLYGELKEYFPYNSDGKRRFERNKE